MAQSIMALLCVSILLLVGISDCFQAAHYQHALSAAILFYEAQRSGELPMNQRVKWRGNSALQDGSEVNVNLVGGYYDAGDNVKFGFPMAFTITMLAWGAVEYDQQIADAGELENLKDAIRWGTDYLLRAHTGPRELWVQVGDPNKDHSCWQRPEDIEPPRTSYLINENSPGTEVAAETSAAMAASSIVFKDSDPTYSSQLLQSAIQLFEFANEARGSFGGGCPFYCSYSGYNDELLWDASWLYKATGSAEYLKYIFDNMSWSQKVTEFTWDKKDAGFQVLLSKMNGFEQYKDYANSFFCAILPNTPQTSVSRTPGGLLYIRSNTNTQYTTGASFLAAVYADYLGDASFTCGSAIFTSRDLMQFAASQVDYILGANPLRMSYMVGFGDNFPQQPHHRGASIESIYTHPTHVECNDGFGEWFNRNSPNPNLLTGAIVGGPDQNDQFVDSRSNYAQLEPATYVNAPLVGLLGRLYAS